MSQNENDLMDSLLDSLSDTEEMEKKIDEFARNKERKRRIQRARETSEQFQQTYSSSAKQHRTEKTAESTAGTTQDSLPPVSPASKPQTPVPEEKPIDIPDFVGTSAPSDPTIPLGSLRSSMYSSASETKTQTAAPEATRRITPVSPAAPADAGATIRFSQPISSSHPAQEEPVQSSGNTEEIQTTRVLPTGVSPAASKAAEPADKGQTRVFSSSNPPRPAAPDVSSTAQGGGTVRVSNDEIRTLLEKEEPILKREYIQDDEDLEDYSIEPDQRYRKPARRSSHLYMILGVAFLCLLLVGGAGFAVKNFIDSSLNTTQNDTEYNRLSTWLARFNTYSDEEKKQIRNFRQEYEKLSTDLKNRINDQAVQLTGKTFDQLLAAANKGEVPESSNENVANAERKAKIKDEIASLEADIRSLTNDLNSINNRIAQAKTDYDTATNSYNAANNDVNACQNTYNSLAAQLASIPSDESIQAQIVALQQQVEQMITHTPPSQIIPPFSYPSDSSEDDDDSTTGSTVISSPGNSSSALEERQALLDEIDGLKAQMQENEALRQSYQIQLVDAQQALEIAKEKVPEARSAMDTAYGAWLAIKDDGAPIQAQIDSKTAQIAELQAELNSID